MKIVRSVLDWLYQFSAVAAGGFLLAIFVLMLLLSAGRPLGRNVRSGDEFIGWCMVAVSFLALAHTFRQTGMARAPRRPCASPAGDPAGEHLLVVLGDGRPDHGAGASVLGGYRRLPALQAGATKAGKRTATRLPVSVVAV